LQLYTRLQKPNKRLAERQYRALHQNSINIQRNVYKLPRYHNQIKRPHQITLNQLWGVTSSPMHNSQINVFRQGSSAIWCRLYRRHGQTLIALMYPAQLNNWRLDCSQHWAPTSTGVPRCADWNAGANGSATCLMMLHVALTALQIKHQQCCIVSV